MFVYFLRHATESRFKIGKANDIYGRMPAIGGAQSFQLEHSFCVQLSTENDAYRLEKMLHRLFHAWKVDPDSEKRYVGDTEQFQIECIERVVKFLNDNADLTRASMPSALPPRPLVNKLPTQTEQRRPERGQAEAKATEERLATFQSLQEKTLHILRRITTDIESGHMRAGIWSKDSDSDRKKLFLALNRNSDVDSDFITFELTQTYFLSADGHICSVFGGYCFQDGLGIIDYRWNDVARDGDQASDQVQEIRALLNRIPSIDDAGVFSLLQLCGFVEPVELMGLTGVKEKIRRILLHVNSGDGFPTTTGFDSPIAWIFAYCVLGLETLGMSQAEINRAIKRIRSRALRELEKWDREEEPVWGSYIYKMPLPPLRRS